jgi:isopentenyldiphosphate isomerase
MGGRGADREILIVDAENRPAGVATRRRMHLGKLVHRAIHGLVYDDAGRIWLSQRDDVVGRDKLDVSVTEHVWEGEDFAETASRALARRLGIPGARSLRALTEVFRDYDEHDGGAEYGGRVIVDDRYMQIFVATWTGEIRPDPRVYRGGEWRRPGEIEALVAADPNRFTPHFVKDWLRVRERLGSILPRG